MPCYPGFFNVAGPWTARRGPRLRGLAPLLLEAVAGDVQRPADLFAAQKNSKTSGFMIFGVLGVGVHRG